jgi:hypothetical protein
MLAWLALKIIYCVFFLEEGSLEFSSLNGRSNS